MKSPHSILTAVLATTLLPGMACAEIITFDFEGLAGADLSGHASAMTSVSNGGITLTLEAATGLVLGSSIGTFNLTASNGFGINNTGSDVTDAFDADLTVVPLPLIDFANFKVTSNVALTDLTLVSLEFDRFTKTAADEGGLTINNAVVGAFGPTFDDDDLSSSSNVLAVGESGLTAASEIALSYVGGNGFGLEFITFDATAAAAVPEPDTLITAAILCSGFLIRRRSKRPLPDSLA